MLSVGVLHENTEQKNKIILVLIGNFFQLFSHENVNFSKWFFKFQRKIKTTLSNARVYFKLD